MAGATIRLNKTKLMELEKRLPGQAGMVVQKMALDCEADIKLNFSSESPSQPGDPPGVDTGNLKNSVIAEPVTELSWVVKIGAEYGSHLEYGTHNDDGSTRMAARPFVRPAVERTADRAPEWLIEAVEL